MSDYVRAQRARFAHPLFQASKRNPFCQGYAWDWLVANAAWKDHQIRVGGKVVTIRRGQLCHSVRHLGEVWGWSKSAVDRFLLRLQTEEMIGTDAGTGQTIITICNYDKYQGRRDRSRDSAAEAKGDSSGTAAGQDRRREEKEEGRKEDPPPPDPTSERDAVVVAVQPPDPTDRERLLVAMGHPSSGLTATGRIVGSPTDMLEAQRWRTDLGLEIGDQIAVVAEVMATKRDGPPSSFRYFREAMQRRAGLIREGPLAPLASPQVAAIPAFDLEAFKRDNPEFAR